MYRIGKLENLEKRFYIINNNDDNNDKIEIIDSLIKERKIKIPILG